MAHADAYWSLVNDGYSASQLAQKQLPASSFRLDIDQFRVALSGLKNQSSNNIILPRADGSLNKFSIQQTFVVAQELALKYPNFKTYKIQHSSRPDIYGRMELMANTLSVMIQTPNGQELINLQSGLSSVYQARHKKSLKKRSFSCGTVNSTNQNSLAMRLAENNQYRAPVNQLTKLRLAIATTVEYSAQFGTSKAVVLAEIMRAVNRINEVYENELAITLELVANNEQIIFIGSDEFSNDNATALIDESQELISSVIGGVNYDIGHIFSTGGGGLASVASVCQNSAKAQGVTGNANPTTDSFWIDFVAHEIGHQLGAEHTFNGTSGSCVGVNRVNRYAFEPGSGSTIMAYAGICEGENLQSNSSVNFHSQSILAISNAMPANCGVNVSSAVSNPNNPTVAAGQDYNIPINTPFVLTANGSDLDNDEVFYQWDGIDKGTATDSDSIGCDLKDNALFQSNPAKTENRRYFPSIETLLSKQAYAGETLPTTDRNINFTVKVTDNKGGYATDDLSLISHTVSSAFRVTSQSSVENLQVNSVVTVNWDVAGTSVAPISCSTVDIQLLSFNADKSTFGVQMVSAGEPNNGSASIRMPADGNSSASRFMVKCSNNVFFSINGADFRVSGGANSAVNNTDSSSGGIDLTNNAIATSLALCPFIATTTPTPTENSSGGGIIPLWLLMFFSGLLLARRRF